MVHVGPLRRSIIEPCGAKLNGAVSLPNPSAVGCSGVGTKRRIDLDLEQAELVRTSFLRSTTYTCRFASLYDWAALQLFCKRL